MLAIELVIIAVCLVGLIVLARISNSDNPPSWIENDGLLGLMMAAMASGIMFSSIGVIITAEEITGSPTLDVFIGIGILLGSVAILTVMTRTGKLARDK